MIQRFRILERNDGKFVLEDLRSVNTTFHGFTNGGVLRLQSSGSYQSLGVFDSYDHAYKAMQDVVRAEFGLKIKQIVKTFDNEGKEVCLDSKK